MFLLRSVRENDLSNLYELASQVSFINLPADKDIIEKKISQSLTCFKNPYKEFYKNYYFFVIEDLENNSVVGASMIHAQHGTEDEPHFYLKVGQERKYSETINTGFIHGTLKLGIETDGPTEIGGLVLDPKYRGNPNKLGKQISFVRFLYMGANPKRFKKTIHSELMPPLDKDGNSPLWEAIGRRFLNMDYHDADVLSRSNKEFILSLYPSDTIYQTLLPTIARNAIGKVGEDTKPVKKMLESIGFTYTHEVDPFDGGPHFRAQLNEIKPIKDMYQGPIEVLDNKLEDPNLCKRLITIPSQDDGFRAILVPSVLKNNLLSVYVPRKYHSLVKGIENTNAISL